MNPTAKNFWLSPLSQDFDAAGLYCLSTEFFDELRFLQYKAAVV